MSAAENDEQELLSYRCYNCQSLRLNVVVRAWAPLYQEPDGGTSTGAVERTAQFWDDESSMRCCDCQAQGEAADFEIASVYHRVNALQAELELKATRS
jgi:hypothetical protein